MNDMTSTYKSVIDEIAELNWSGLTGNELSAVATAYWYFSIQFRENLEIALQANPDDPQLQLLHREECNTDNLSPWPDVAAPNERLNHDEFMKRVLSLSPIPAEQQIISRMAGENYLACTGQVADETRAMSIVSYEDGGLETVFRAILRAPTWDTPLLAGFRHFLLKHIEFDSDPEDGHGAMIRHLQPDGSIRCLWLAFLNLLIETVPALKK